MPTRDQLTQEGFHALIDLIIEENKTPAGEMPPSEYIARLKHIREFGEAQQLCDYCSKAAEHLQDYQ